MIYTHVKLYKCQSAYNRVNYHRACHHAQQIPELFLLLFLGTLRADITEFHRGHDLPPSDFPIRRFAEEQQQQTMRNNAKKKEKIATC